MGARKKVLIINGSYHEHGMVTQLVDSFAAGAKESDPSCDVEIVDLVKLKMEYCHGCWSCTKKEGKIGQCLIADDIERVLAKMLTCDVLVFASPIYEFGPTAVMKKFMERNLPIIGPEGFLKGRHKKNRKKIGVIILSSGAPWPINVIWGVTRYPMKMLTWLLKLWSCGKIYSIKAGGMEANEKTKARFIRKGRELGRKILAKR